MKCTYKFNGKTFDSELKLDEEIIRLRKFIDDVADFAFSKKHSERSEYNHKLLLDMHKEATEIQVKYGDKEKITGEDIANWINEEYWGLDDRIPKIDKRGYSTVTQTIAGLTFLGTDGEQHPVFPIFDAKNYWENMKDKLMHIEDWVDVENMTFKPDPEHNKVWFNKEFCEFMFGSMDKVHNLREDELDYYQKRMQYGVWKLQTKAGNLVHNLMRICMEFLFEDKTKTAEDICRELWKFKPPSDYFQREKDADKCDTQKLLEKAKEDNNGFSMFYDNGYSVVQSVADCAKLLMTNIRKKYPNNPRVYTELKVIGDTTQNYQPLRVLGQIDLLVMDDDGNVDIYDYKCSTKDYSEFDTAKQRTFLYQLALYRRLVQQLGLRSETSIGINIIPIKFTNFSYDDDGDPIKNGRITFGGIALDGDNSSYQNITKSLDYAMTGEVTERLNKIMRDEEKVQDNENISSNVSDFMSKIAPEYWKHRSDRDSDEVLTKKVTETLDGKIQDSEDGTGKRFWYNERSKKKYEGKNDLEIIEKVKEDWKKGHKNSREVAESIHKLLHESQSGESDFNFRSVGKLHDDEHGTYQMPEQFLKQYAGPEWEVLTPMSEEESMTDEIKILMSHGLIIVRNKFSKQVDFIKITDADLFYENNLGTKSDPRKYIMGRYLSDDAQTGNQDSLALKALSGNMELIETMALINQLPQTMQILGDSIGKITVLNPSGFNGISGLSASNEQLLYNFTRLCSLTRTKNNFAKNLSNKTSNGIKMCSYADLVQKQLNSIALSDTDNKFGRKLLDDSILKYDDQLKQSIFDVNNPESKLIQLQNLKRELEEKYENLKGAVVGDADVTQHPEYEVYNNVLLAIAEASGVKLQQQTENNPRFFGDLSKILTEGFNGSYFDNPGTLKSNNLNQMAYITERAYQNTRRSVSKFNEILVQKVQKLKESKNFSWLEKVTIGNQASIYQNLYDKDLKKSGELRFKRFDDPTLSAAEREFLEFAVRQLAINNSSAVSNDTSFNVLDSNGQFSEEKFQKEYREKPELILQVPLVRADFASKVASSGGILSALKSVFSVFLPKNFKKYATRAYEFLDDTEGKDSQKSKAKAGELFTMVNRIKNSYNKDKRDHLLKTYDPVEGDVYHVDEFEQNVEKLLLSSQMANSMEKELNRVFPQLKAIIVNLVGQGVIQNTEFTDDIKFALDYIKNKIQGLPLEDLEKLSVARLAVQEVMSTTSKLALAFNPLQLYQMIDGLWKDIMLIRQRPDVDIPDDSAFTRQNMLDSAMWILDDIKHFGDTQSLGEALNRLYGINDMDINTYADRLNTDNAGIFNFWSVGFRFSSRPDYYNRMTIFGAQMRKDGSFEAHRINEKGELIYDWKLDKRFSKYAAGDKSDIELYNKQKALYLTMANEFVLEGATNDDGTLFKIGDDEHPTALPRAYTTKQSESMKALGDKIYGYYSHEKRSMIQSYTLGAMFMQMHTYWSSKKNQYVTGHGFTQQGQFEQYEEQRTNENGELETVKYWLDEDGLPTEEKTGVPFMVWKGRPQEGIMVTLMHLAKDVLIGQHDDDGNIQIDENGNKMVGFGYMFDKNFGQHADAKLRALYRANMNQLGYDLFMLIFMGMIVSPALLNAANEYAKDKGNKTLNDAVINTSVIGLARMLNTSTDDFNMIKSIFGQVADWDPFSLSMMKRLYKSSMDLFFSDKDGYDTLINFAAATRNTRPLFDYAKYEVTGRRIGEHAV